MSVFLDHTSHFNEPVLLSETKRKDPLQVVRDFFTDYRLSELRQTQEEIEEICLTTDRPPFSDPERRADFLLYERNLIELLEAAFLLAKATTP